MAQRLHRTGPRPRRSTEPKWSAVPHGLLRVGTLRRRPVGIARQAHRLIRRAGAGHGGLNSPTSRCRPPTPPWPGRRPCRDALDPARAIPGAIPGADELSLALGWGWSAPNLASGWNGIQTRCVSQTSRSRRRSRFRCAAAPSSWPHARDGAYRRTGERGSTGRATRSRTGCRGRAVTKPERERRALADLPTLPS